MLEQPHPAWKLPAFHNSETGNGRIAIGTQKDRPRKVQNQTGKALEARWWVESIAWRLANKNAGARETGQERRYRRTAPDFRQQLCLQIGPNNRLRYGMAGSGKMRNSAGRGNERKMGVNLTKPVPGENAGR